MLCRRQALAGWPLPAIQNTEDAEKGRGIEEKYSSGSRDGNNEPPQSRTNGASNVKPDAV
jgi:hypothetical protein